MSPHRQSRPWMAPAIYPSGDGYAECSPRQPFWLPLIKKRHFREFCAWHDPTLVCIRKGNKRKICQNFHIYKDPTKPNYDMKSKLLTAALVAFTAILPSIGAFAGELDLSCAATYGSLAG